MSRNFARASCSLLSGCLAMLGTLPAPAAAQELAVEIAPSPATGLSSKDQLTALILHDLEFTLLTWKTPSPYPNELAAWIDTTKSRLNGLKLMAADAGLNGNVANAIEAVDDILDEYSSLSRTLRTAEWVVTSDMTEGDQTPFSVGSQVVGATMEGAQLGWEVGAATGAAHGGAIGAATCGLLAGSGEALGHYGRKLEESSKHARLDGVKASFVQGEIEQAQGRFTFGLVQVQRFAAAAGAGRPIAVPTFELHGDLERYERSFPGSPYPHALRAFRLTHQDRPSAAAQYAAAASKLPRNRYFSLYFRGPYLLFAGHLMEYESRYGTAPAGRSAAAREALRYYRQAAGELERIANFPYSYLISYARALVAGGDKARAMAIAEDIAKYMPGEKLPRAARAYDLGCLLALAGDTAQSLVWLKESYRVFPRRDPYALQDPLLRNLWSSEWGREQLRRLADHPLVGGTWVSANDNGATQYQFFPDRSLWQRRSVLETLTGKWSTDEGPTLRLYERSGGVPEATPTFKVEGDNLVLFHQGHEYPYRRRDGGLLAGYGKKSATGRVMAEDGSFTRAVGLQVESGRFSTSRTLTDSNRKFWYYWEDPVAGPLYELKSERVQIQ